jgi:dihydrofolate reductase
MRKIIVGASVSLDGVVQAPGAATEDPTNGFKLGGWAMSHFDQAAGEELVGLFTEDCDLLLGRKTYEILAAFWPFFDATSPFGFIATRFNRIKKYVVSRSGDVDLSWQGSVLLRDIAQVKRLRDEDGPPLITQGSADLVHALFANDLVDAINVLIVPVVLGGGKKLFADGSVPQRYTLTRSRVGSTGLVIARYERAGGITIEDPAPGAPSNLELKRRERVKREG